MTTISSLSSHPVAVVQVSESPSRKKSFKIAALSDFSAYVPLEVQKGGEGSGAEAYEQ